MPQWAVDEGVVLFTDLPASFASSLDQQSVATTDLITAFQNKGYTLNETTQVTVVQSGSSWSLLVCNPLATQGYIGFNLVIPAPGSLITVYGSVILIERLGDNNKQVAVSLDVHPTQLTPDNFDDFTVCPNGFTFKVNKEKNLTWEQMMTAQEEPSPPTCVSNGNSWCPTPSPRKRANGR